MILRPTCLRIRAIRTFHASAQTSAAAKILPTSNITPSTSVNAPFPPKTRPQENDPTYVHPPSSIKAGQSIKGVQILKDQPEIVAQPDDFYPDWLWQILDDPQSVQDRVAAKRGIEKKMDIYIAQLKEEETKKRLLESKKNRNPKSSERRSQEEKKMVRREAQNEGWIVNREKEYDVPQFEMPPERNVKFHKRINKENIKQENYLRARGMK